ncbi:MAG: sugar transporter permease [Chloroflexi bacterium]|nr:sugar transporter permease [Chloroflexota bacterium]MDB5077280.1 sugar transporter permease [Chloroflexota bacterium]
MKAAIGIRRTNIVTVVTRVREAGIAVFLLLLVVFFATRSPHFLTGNNFNNILAAIAVLTIVAVGETCVILARQIDLSVGSILGMSALVVAVSMRDHPDLPVVVPFLIGSAVGLALGAFNGLLVTFGRLPSIIVTLGTLYVFRGIIVVYSNYTTQSGEVYSQETGASPSFANLATANPLGLQNSVIIAVLIAVLFAYMLRKTRTGRAIYAVGGNPLAANLAGLKVNRTTFLVFALSGMLAGLAAVLYTSLHLDITVHEGENFELTVISAVVIGGTNIFGGSGTIFGTVLGALVIGVVQNGLQTSNISSLWEQAIYGFAILGAVIVDALITRRLQLALRLRAQRKDEGVAGP